MNGTFTRLACVLAAVGVAAGCTITHRVGQPQTTSLTPITPTELPPTQAQASCPAGQQASDGRQCVNCPQLKPCFVDSAEMHTMAAEIYPAIEQYSKNVLDGSVPPARWAVVAHGSGMLSPCEPFTSQSGPMFCNRDDTIYLGEDDMWDMYNTNDRGDAVNVVVMAHEWGHHVQMHMGALSPHPTLEQMRMQETQADCISGAVARYMHQNGYFSDDDLHGVLSFMPNIPTDPYGTHGTNEQRIAAFEVGYGDGIAACNPIGISSVTPN